MLHIVGQVSVKVPSGCRLCVYLSSRVAIVEFVFISQRKLLWEFLLHFVIRHLFAHSLRKTHPEHNALV